MADGYIREARHKIMGKVGMETGGRKVARNENSHILGYYDARKNLTYDRNNHIIAQGDVTAALVYRTGR